MSVVAETRKRIQNLERLIDRLSAPDLTACEANDLRPRLLEILERIEIERERINGDPARRAVDTSNLSV
jgi:hypothetical protein